jgi:hypothetical protein
VADVGLEDDTEHYGTTKNYDVGVEESNTDNFNIESGCERSKVVSIRRVGGGCFNSIV